MKIAFGTRLEEENTALERLEQPEKEATDDVQHNGAATRARTARNYGKNSPTGEKSGDQS